MPIYTWKAIFLGNAADMDPDDADFTAENAASLLGIYGSVTDPLRKNIVDISANDADADTNMNYDDPSEDVVIDGVTNTLDSGAVFNATLTYTDGTTASITAVVLQMANGDLYLAPEMAANADKAAMEAKPIRSISLDSVDTATTTIAAQRQQTNFLCMAEDARIATPRGLVSIAALSEGDAVLTLDNGPQPIRRILHRRFGLLHMVCRRLPAPVIVPRNAFGTGCPDRPLRLSTQHRMLISSPVAQKMFGNPEVLVASKQLVGWHGIERDFRLRQIGLINLLFDRHEIIFANGLPVESLLPGPEALRVMDFQEAQTFFPARPIVEGPRMKRFLARLAAREDRHGKARPPEPARPRMANRPTRPGISPAC